MQVRYSKWLSAEFSIVFLSDPRPTRLPPSTSQLRPTEAFPPCNEPTYSPLGPSQMLAFRRTHARTFELP